jgi:hypothetical protein
MDNSLRQNPFPSGVRVAFRCFHMSSPSASGRTLVTPLILLRSKRVRDGLRKLAAPGLCVLALLAFGCREAPRAQNVSPTFFETRDSNPERGRKLADVMLCSFCHSPMTLDGGLQLYNDRLRLAGGIKVVAPPYGTFYTRNLTPDPETGIGTWSSVEIARAITVGIKKDGNGMGVMPVHYFQNVRNQDLNDLIAYLRSVPPVQRRIPAPTPMPPMDKVSAGLRLILPFLDYPSQDWFYAGQDSISASIPSTAKELHLPPPTGSALIVKPLRSSPQIEQGEYLATITACAFCHTPVEVGGQRVKKALSGGFRVVDPMCGTIYSRNLTPDKETGLGTWSDEEIERAIRHGVGRDGHLLCPTVMPWQAFSQFSDDDIRSIISYLRAIPAVSHYVPADVPASGKEAPIQRFFMGDAGS